jgi:Flp pilus assembly protein TadG
MAGTFLRLWRGEAGGVVVAFSLSLPVILVAGAASLEYANLTLTRTKLQVAADDAALAAAREIQIANTTDTQVISVARAVALASLSKGGATPSGTQVNTTIADARTSVAVEVTEAVRSVFGQIMTMPTSSITTRAQAKLLGGTKLCLIGLDPSMTGTVGLFNSARLTAEGCSVQSNSTHPSGISLQNSAAMKAAKICSSGGASGSGYSPAAKLDCPAIPDPLKDRPAPLIGSCTHQNKNINGGVHTLLPGVYCGGLTITNNSKVTFSQGTYIIKDGPLQVMSGASVAGEYVGFYLTGQTARFQFGFDTSVSLTAPKSGDLAGLLFFRDRNVPANDTNFMTSNNARKLVGTIYMPASTLHIDAQNPVADESAYTVIVVHRLQLFSGPNLVLNTNYGASDVPVPKGVGPLSSSISLVQ